MKLKRIKSLFQQFKQGLNVWTFLLPLLSILVLSGVAYGISDVIPQLNFGVIFSISIIGLSIAWILASTKIRALFAGFLALILGLFVVLIRSGGLESELFHAIQSLLETTNETFSQGVQVPFQELSTHIGILLDRSREWFTAFASGKPIFDPIVTAMVWGFAMWGTSIWTGWMIQRSKQPLLGIIPAGGLLAVTLSYTLADTSALLIMIGVTLFLIAVSQQRSIEKRWWLKDVRFSPDIRKSSLTLGVGISLAIVSLAALTPFITIQDIVDLGKRWTSGQSSETDQVAESLGLSSSPRRKRTAIDNVRVSGLPQEHLLGSGPELSEKVMLQIRNLGEQTGEDLSTIYWRSITYDQYTGSAWLTSATYTETFEDGQLVTTTKKSFQQSLSQEVEFVSQVGRLLYFAGTLVSVDQEFLISQRSNQDLFGASIDTNSYQVDTLVPTFNEEELRKTGIDYPEWIQKRYLVLPENLPQRVQDLAQELTATEQTPYDRVLAIETYLRSFPYSLQVPPTSPYHEIVDHFLFDLKRGYCGYYATSMVVLARAAGIPARIVIGYASNNYDAASGQYIVTAADAHAWVEVYFPYYGWVEFEPTPNRPTIPRLGEPPSDEIPLQEETTKTKDFLNLRNLSVNLTFQKLWSGFRIFLGFLSLTSLAAVIGWSWIDTLRIRLMAPVIAIPILYHRLQAYARRLGVPYREGDTPYEFFSTFTQHLNEHYRKGAPLSEIFQPIRSLINLYVQVSYTPWSPETDEATLVVKSWGQIGRNLTVLRLKRMLGNLKQRFQLSNVAGRPGPTP